LKIIQNQNSFLVRLFRKTFDSFFFEFYDMEDVSGKRKGRPSRTTKEEDKQELKYSAHEQTVFPITSIILQ
jgi:hypothetical protein